MLRNWIIGAGLISLCACAASAAHFEGSRQSAVVSAAGVQVGGRPPDGTRRLGRSSADCSPLDSGEELDRVRFSDLACSHALLQSALREAAAQAGGSFSSAPECDEKRSTGSSGERVSWLGCDAEVWGPAGAAQPATTPASREYVQPAPGAPLLGSVRDAWQIELDFWPVNAGPRRAPRDPESVAEVDFPQVGQLRLGDLTAECEQGCATLSLRRGLRAAAAWLGATTLVDVRCIQRGRISSCAASVSAPERDEPELLGNR